MAFFAVVWVVAAWVLPHNVGGWVARVPFINHYGMKHLLGFDGGEYATLTLLILALGAGLLAHYFGFHPAVGAYMAGLILREEYFEQGADRQSYRDTKKVLDSVAFTWIGSVFFVHLGSQIIFDWQIALSIVPQTVVLTVGLLVVQILSAGLADRYTSGMNLPNSWLIGFGVLGRSELAFVVMDIAYVQKEIMSTEAFYTLMFTALWLNIAVPVTISLWRRRYGLEMATNASA